MADKPDIAGLHLITSFPYNTVSKSLIGYLTVIILVSISLAKTGVLNKSLYSLLSRPI